MILVIIFRAPFFLSTQSECVHVFSYCLFDIAFRMVIRIAMGVLAYISHKYKMVLEYCTNHKNRMMHCMIAYGQENQHDVLTRSAYHK